MTNRVIVVANRTPSSDINPSGLISAVSPMFSRYPAAWLGWNGRTASGKAVPHKSKLGEIDLISVPLTPNQLEFYYNGYCNQALWPLFHGFLGRSAFDHRHYASYLQFNRTLSRHLSAEMKPGDIVWVQDYHMIPIAWYLRRISRACRLALFLHIPVPAAASLRALRCHSDLARMINAYDLVAVNTKRDADNIEEFLADAGGDRLLECAHTKIVVAPESIDFAWWANTALGEGTPSDMLDVFNKSAGRSIILSVERADYTKGSINRLLALERMFTRRPCLAERFVVVQVSVPTRTGIQAYERERARIDLLADRLNSHSPQALPVIVPINEPMSSTQLAALYRESDICIVSSISDGMNLVAKEYVACQVGKKGVLVLSRGCGAAEGMSEALLFDPSDVDDAALAIEEGLDMTEAERASRMETLRTGVEEWDAIAWAQYVLGILKQ